MVPYAAVLDIGSNSVKLLVAQQTAGGLPEEELELTTITRLGTGLEASGRLEPAAVERTVAAMGALLERLPHGRGAGHGLAAATSAVRNAANRELFVNACRERLGGEPRIVSGEEEARTAFLGAVSDRPAGERVVTIEIGGGSTELAVGTPGDCAWHRCLEVGCVRLGESYGLFEVAAPGQVGAAQAAVRAATAEAVREIRALAGPNAAPTVVVSGGTAATFAAVQAGVTSYERRIVHGYRADTTVLGATLDRLLRLPSVERARIPGIEPGRAPVLPAGLLILQELLRELGQPRFQTSARGLRYGLLLRLATGELEPTWTWV